MGRFRRNDEQAEPETAVDMSPMMDCVFILLIFFIVTTTFVEAVDVEIDKPFSVNSEQLEKTSIMIGLTDKGEVVYGGKPLKLAGVRPLVRRLLSDEDDKVPVVIIPDTNADAAMVVELIHEADLAGAETISIATRSAAN